MDNMLIRFLSGKKHNSGELDEQIESSTRASERAVTAVKAARLDLKSALDELARARAERHE